LLVATISADGEIAVLKGAVLLAASESVVELPVVATPLTEPETGAV